MTTPVTHNLTAIGLMIVAVMLLTVLDTSAKLLTANLPSVQIVWVRLLGHQILVTLIAVSLEGSGVLRARKPGLQALRSLMLTASTLCNFAALAYLPLSTTSAIFFSVPLWTAALAVLLLGERVGPRRWTCIALGFVGVLIIIRPGPDILQSATLIACCTAVFASLYNLSTRALAGADTTQTTQAYSALSGVIILAPVMPFVWVTPPHALDWLLLAMTGVFGAAGHYCIILAHRYAPASVIAPFIYPQIVFMTLSGFVIFGDLPDIYVVLGAALVISSGLYLWHRERVLAKRASLPI